MAKKYNLNYGLLKKVHIFSFGKSTLMALLIFSMNSSCLQKLDPSSEKGLSPSAELPGSNGSTDGGTEENSQHSAPGSGDGDSGASEGAGGGPDSTASTLSEKYPNDNWDLEDPSILFASGFENGTMGWDSVGSYSGDSASVVEDSALANSGQNVFRMLFTLSDLESGGSASVRAIKYVSSDSNTTFVRYYSRFEQGTARPHHGSGINVFAPGFDLGGTAGLRPNGDERYNTRIDIDGNGNHFFYTYWHEMRSWKCNDGTTTPGCEGEQGSAGSNNSYYGNSFKPLNQPSVNIYEWNCYEFKLKANTPNEYDGELALWINGVFIGEFKEGTPEGAWLRDNFYLNGEYGTGDQKEPFEGFNFRTSSDVSRIKVILENYQQWNTLSQNRSDTPNKAENQITYYDDFIIAKERIGCQIRE